MSSINRLGKLLFEHAVQSYTPSLSPSIIVKAKRGKTGCCETAWYIWKAGITEQCHLPSQLHLLVQRLYFYCQDLLACVHVYRTH